MATNQYSNNNMLHTYSLFNDKENSMKIRRLRETGKLTNQKVIDLYNLQQKKYSKNTVSTKKFNLGRVKSMKPKRSDSKPVENKDKFLVGSNFSKKLQKSGKHLKFKNRLESKLQAEKNYYRNTRGNSSTKDYSHKTIDKYTSSIGKDRVIHRSISPKEKSQDGDWVYEGRQIDLSAKENSHEFHEI